MGIANCACTEIQWQVTTVDFRILNKHVIQERRQIPTMDEITANIHGASVFSVLDAESGFHQLELDETSSNLTTFITHKKNLQRFLASHSTSL